MLDEKKQLTEEILGFRDAFEQTIHQIVLSSVTLGADGRNACDDHTVTSLSVAFISMVLWSCQNVFVSDPIDTKTLSYFSRPVM